jgi:hypothetical protein
MANQDDKSKLPEGQEGTTGNDQGMTESRPGDDMDAGNMQHGKIGGAGLPDNLDSTTDSSSGAGSAGATGGDIGGGGGTAGSLKGNSSVAED